MTLAVDYARACHERIHLNLLNALGLKKLHVVENYRKFAWKDGICINTKTKGIQLLAVLFINQDKVFLLPKLVSSQS